MNNSIKLPELLSPAGNLEKLKYAVNYGCDAVYLGMKSFGMRAAADNFSPEDLAEGLDFAHSKGVKVYLTLNTMPRDFEFNGLAETLNEISGLPVDAFIIADIGVAELIKQKRPEAELHISTQVSTMNSSSCIFWHKYGAKRVVFSRELSLEEIKIIRQNTPKELELEAFVHGAMCVAYSGRCLMSNYYTSRDANRGRCTQPCRWSYNVTEEKRPELPLEVSVAGDGTHIFSSRDLCMIEHIKELAEAGIDSLKIEGRMKSAYYTAAVTNAYRMALRDYAENPDAPLNKRYLDEIGGVSHRDYDTGFFFGSPIDDPKICRVNEYIKDKAFLATVEAYDPKTGLSLCKQKNKMLAGEAVMLLKPGKVAEEAVIQKLFDSEMNEITSTPHPGMLFYTDVGKTSQGDIIRGR